jgi:tRNA (cytidine/uridine-2'-O-)-methyltransferase
MRLALYQPEIPQNTGTLIRLAACMELEGVDIIEPTGFIWNDKKLKRAGMDYIDLVNVNKHDSIETFLKKSFNSNHRVILLDTKSEIIFWDFNYHPHDILLVGRESDGVPQSVFNKIENKVKIPMNNNTRSLNMAIAASIILSEGLRQTRHSKNM